MDRFLLFWLGIELLVDYDRVNFGAGITMDGISLDGGETWYLCYQGDIYPEEDFILGLHVYNSLGGCSAAGLA
ncbi:MAG: hypothetical protein WCV71_02475 [Patescibacteria group bacterium]